MPQRRLRHGGCLGSKGAVFKTGTAVGVLACLRAGCGRTHTDVSDGLRLDMRAVVPADAAGSHVSVILRPRIFRIPPVVGIGIDGDFFCLRLTAFRAEINHCSLFRAGR